jgi:hypothetical protein
MANARHPAPEVGYRLFLTGGTMATLEVINEALRSKGLDPVSQRMYDHYRKLKRLGYSDYVPINQVDTGAA